MMRPSASRRPPRRILELCSSRTLRSAGPESEYHVAATRFSRAPRQDEIPSGLVLDFAPCSASQLLGEAPNCLRKQREKCGKSENPSSVATSVADAPSA